MKRAVSSEKDMGRLDNRLKKTQRLRWFQHLDLGLDGEMGE